MNRAAHVFLGLAIAIVFPAFVFYAAITFVPDAKTSVTAPQYPRISPPTQPYCGAVSSSASNSERLRTEQECAQLQSEYDQQQTAYDQAQSSYDRQQSAYVASLHANESVNQERRFDRAIVAVVLALAGIGALAAMASVPTLVYGLASGAGLTLIVGIGVILGSAPDDRQRLAAGILLGLFVVCAALMLWYERAMGGPTAPTLVMPEPLAPAPLPEPPVSAAPAPADAPHDAGHTEH